MKATIITLYFTAMLFIVAYLVTDLGYTYPDALFISSTYLPTVVLAHTLTNGFRFRERATIIGCASAVIAIFILQLLLITLANYSLHRLSYGITMPEIVINPILIFLIFMLYYLPYRLIIERILQKSKDDPKERTIEFISNRKRVNIALRDILYIESRDTEVWLHRVDGDSFRSRTNISSWQRELDDTFIRVHRSYLVNGGLIESANREEVTLRGGVKLPISRTYQQRVEEHMAKAN